MKQWQRQLHNGVGVFVCPSVEAAVSAAILKTRRRHACHHSIVLRKSQSTSTAERVPKRFAIQKALLKVLGFEGYLCVYHVDFSRFAPRFSPAQRLCAQLLPQRHISSRTPRRVISWKSRKAGKNCKSVA